MTICTPNGAYVCFTHSTTAFQGSDAVWEQVVQCVKQAYADFDVQIVTDRPASGNYHMAIVAGYSSDVGESDGVMGVSPFTCGYIPDAISFTFANEEPTNLYDLCWTCRRRPRTRGASTTSSTIAIR